MRLSISDYTEADFIELLQRIIGNTESEAEENRLVQHFNNLCGHPAGSDLIFYPEPGADDSPEGITKTVKAWRAANALPGFKET